MVVFTDCGIGLGTSSLPGLIKSLEGKSRSEKLSAAQATFLNISPQKAARTDDSTEQDWIPFSDASKLSFVCIGHAQDSYYEHAIKLYQQLLDTSGQKGQLFTSADANGKKENNPSADSTLERFPTPNQWRNEVLPKMVEKLCEANYKTFEAELNCGGFHKLKSPIIIWPAPMVRPPEMQ